MTIAAFSTAGFSQYIAASSNVSASQQAFHSLEQSLASGNLAAAQSAFNTYQQLNQSPAGTGTTGTSTAGTGTAGTSTAGTGTGTPSTPSQFSTDLTALGTAIGSGNLSTAQSAFATLQGDLKTAPSQAVTNAETAVAQTVSWVDDLLNLSSNTTANTVNEDPTTAILDSAYGQNPDHSATDPTTSILDNAYGIGGTANASSAPSSTKATAAGSGNLGSGASVDAYA